MVCATVAQTQGGRPGQEFWLTEPEAMLVTSQSKTDAALDITERMIAAFYRLRDLMKSSGPVLTAAEVAQMISAATRPIGDAIAQLAQQIGAVQAQGEAAASTSNSCITSVEHENLKRFIDKLVKLEQRAHRMTRNLISHRSEIYCALLSACSWSGPGKKIHRLPSAMLPTAWSLLTARAAAAERTISEMTDDPRQMWLLPADKKNEN